MSNNDLPETLIYTCTDFRFKGVREFFEQIEAAILDGWTVWDNPPPRLAHSMGQVPMVCLVRKEADDEPSLEDTPPEDTAKVEEKGEETPPTIAEGFLIELKKLERLPELKEFASKVEIEIPKDLRKATVIKKYLIAQLEAPPT